MAWYLDQGPECDVVISSRIRLARNLPNLPFPHRMDEGQARQAVDQLEAAFFQDKKPGSGDYLLVDLEPLSPEDRMALAEKRLISEDFAQKAGGHRVIISRDEAISIMINEEDHIRIQSMQAGLNLEVAYQKAVQVADRFEAHIAFAKSGQYGYLTACPTNTGTGMRASIMVHLPGLFLTGRIKHVVTSLQKLSFAVRGPYGEHSKSRGHLFQISNQLTLGLSEADLIQDLERMLQQLLKQERDARQALYSQQGPQLEDRIMRSYGILTFSRLMSAEETEKHLSNLRLGVALGLFPALKPTAINQIQASIGPASIQKVCGRILTTEERDRERAHLIQTILAQTPA